MNIVRIFTPNKDIDFENASFYMRDDGTIVVHELGNKTYTIALFPQKNSYGIYGVANIQKNSGEDYE